MGLNGKFFQPYSQYPVRAWAYVWSRLSIVIMNIIIIAIILKYMNMNYDGNETIEFNLFLKPNVIHLSDPIGFQGSNIVNPYVYLGYMPCIF